MEKKMASKKFKIYRYNPETDKKSAYKTYQVDCLPGGAILDALHEIKWY